MQIKTAIERYLHHRSKRLAKRSIKTYERNLCDFARYVGEDTQLNAITDEMIDAYQVQLQTRVSEATQVNYANTLRGFFKYWTAKGETTVAWELIEGPRIPEKLPNHITESQFEWLDEYLDEDSFDQLTRKVVFHMLWNTGMRIGELLALDISDIRADQNYTYIQTEKSRRNRLVKWSEECHRLLLKYLGIRLALNQRPELFQAPRGNRRCRLTSRSVQRWCKEIEKALGFPVNPHAFRHGKMHYILNQGGRRHDIKVVAGHSSITSSEVYTRLNVKEQSELLDRFIPRQKKYTHSKVRVARRS